MRRICCSTFFVQYPIRYFGCDEFSSNARNMSHKKPQQTPILKRPPLHFDINSLVNWTSAGLTIPTVWVQFSCFWLPPCHRGCYLTQPQRGFEALATIKSATFSLPSKYANHSTIRSKCIHDDHFWIHKNKKATIQMLNSEKRSSTIQWQTLLWLCLSFKYSL